MIDREHDLPITNQAKALNISRGSVYYLPRPVPDADLAIMRRLDRLHLEFPFAGSRMLRGLLAAEGCKIGRRHVKTLMRRMGIEALYRRPRTTKAEPAHGEFESEHPGYCGAQDTFYVGNLKGVGRVYQQTFIDTYTKVACAKLYDRKMPITAADLLNDRVLPLFESHDVKLLRVLTDRGSEFCGNPERHEYELYLAIEDIDHSRTKTKSPQTNGICERFHKTVLNEFYRVAFRKKVYCSIDELQADLDAWIRDYKRASQHPFVYVTEENRFC
jgi:transposase InsO family protein